MAAREAGCPTCPHSVSGYHHDADPCTYPASPKATARNLYCVWCGAWCVRDGVPCNPEVKV